MNYQQNKYNIFRRLLKTSLYYRVKHKSLKTLLYVPLTDNKAVNSTIWKMF